MSLNISELKTLVRYLVKHVVEVRGMWECCRISYLDALDALQTP